MAEHGSRGTDIRDRCRTQGGLTGEDLSKKLWANLWTEFAARRRDALTVNGRELQNPSKLVGAATFEMAKT